MVAPVTPHRLKRHELSPRVEASPQLAALVRSAEPVLIEILDREAGLVEAFWDAGPDDRGRTVVRLRLKDWTGEAEGRFAPRDLENEVKMRSRLHELWGDLLRGQSALLLQQAREAANAMGE